MTADSGFGFSRVKLRIIGVYPDLRLNRSLGHPRDTNQIHILELHAPLSDLPLGVSMRLDGNGLVLLVRTE